MIDSNSGKPAILDMFVLDALRHDAAEQLPSIIRLLNNRGCIGWREFWAADFSEEEVMASLRKLTAIGMVEVLSEDDSATLRACEKPNWNVSQNSLWFGMSSSGRTAWEQWEPPSSVR